jgi:ubiquinone biosynthesis protein
MGCFATVPNFFFRSSFSLAQRNTNYAIQIRLIIEKMGLSYLKLGQFLATRFDILPEELCQELNKLYERVPPMGFAQVEAIIDSELGGAIQNFFPFFNQEPIAAGSVAQVHEARTQAHERVVVKVQRPGIKRIFKADIRNFKYLATLIDGLKLLGKFSLKEVVDEFEQWTEREMDFTNEGYAAEQFHQNAASYEVIPQIYWDLTTSKVLTMEFIEGVSLGEVSQLLEVGGMELLQTRLPELDLDRALHHLIFAVLRQFFLIGFFHGDPHPGNILLRADNTIAFVDFGIFGTLTTYQRETLAGYIENMAVGNIDSSFQYYSSLLTPTSETDSRAFEQEAKSVLRQWHRIAVTPEVPMEERHFGKFASSMFAVVQRHHLRMNMDTLLFWRSIYMIDCNTLGMGTQFNLLNELQEFFQQIRPSPVQKIIDAMIDRSRVLGTAELAYRLPHYANTMLIPHPRVTIIQQTHRSSVKWLVLPIAVISIAEVATVLNLSFPLVAILLSTLFLVLRFATARDR